MEAGDPNWPTGVSKLAGVTSYTNRRERKNLNEKKHLLNSSILSLTSILLGEHIMSYLIPLHSHGAEDCGVDFVNEDPYRMEISLILSRSPFSSASRYSFCACSFVTSGKKSLWIIFSKLCQQKQNTSRRLIQRCNFHGAITVQYMTLIN